MRQLPGQQQCKARHRDRRQVLRWVAGVGIAGWSASTAAGHEPFGPVRPPQPAPRVSLRGHDGRQADLAQFLKGRVTAVQLMFTSCTATCPIQGALFAAVGRKLPPGSPAQLLSISIDPQQDDRPALEAWLRRFGAGPRWQAVAPTQLADVDRMLDFVRGRASGADRHTTQVYFFDAQARLAFRTADLPSPAHVLDMFSQLTAR